uniref:Uncharacterized protein n=2 Tax=Arion vulgaris TaxID=1028688 RepID=A0A0B6YWN1_9EUPU
MALRFLISTSNILLGGTFVIFISLLTWNFPWQIKRFNQNTTSNMALAARTVLITGASRGLGLEYVKQLIKLSSPPEILIAACRDPHSALQLQALAKGSSSVKVIKLDVEIDDSIQSAFKEVKALVGGHGLNLLINNAAIYDQKDEGRLEQQTRSRLQKHFDINVSGPLIVTQTFLPLLQQAASQNKDKPLSCSKAGVIMMTSYMGSQQITFTDGAGEAIHYKTSKSALTMAAVILSRELKESGIFVAALHPGWVRTDMGGDHAMFSPEDSIKGCLKVIGTAGEDFNGKLLTFEGNILPY